MQPIINSQPSPGSPVAQIDSVHVRKRIIELAGPAFVEYFLMSFIGVLNMILVSGLGPNAITAVGLVNQPVFLIQACFMALSVGTTALVARFTGAHEPEQAKSVAIQAIVVTLVLGVLLTVPQVIFARQISLWMGARDEVLDQATAYMKYYVSGTVFLVMPLTMAAIMRGAGDCRIPMLLNILNGAMTAGLGYAFIYGRFGFPRMGVAGAAVGAVIAMAVSTVLFTLALYRGRSLVNLSMRDSHKLDFAVIARIMRIGVPAAAEQFIIRGGQTVFARTVGSLGTLAYAAHQITISAESLAYTPPTAFQVAATTLTGQYLGAEQPELAERAGRQTLRMSLTIMAVLGTICYVFARQILGAYTSDLQVIELALPNMRLFTPALLGMATHYVMVGALRGAGDTKWPLYISLICTWCVRVAGGYLLAIVFGLGLRGAWLVMLADHFIRAALSYVRFHSGRWKSAKV